MKEETEKLFLSMARNIENVTEMSIYLRCTPGYIYYKLKDAGIYTRRKVISLLAEKTDEEIALEGKVDVEAVARVRREIEIEKQRQHDKLRQWTIAQCSQKQEKSIQMAKNSDKRKGCVGAVTRVRQEIKEQREQPKNNNEVQFKIDMLKLRGQIQSLKEVSKQATIVMDYNIQKMLDNYGSLLTQEHYALFAYGYVKVREYMKGIEIGEEYLELETSSLSALQKRIDEILEREKEKSNGKIVNNPVKLHDTHEER